MAVFGKHLLLNCLCHLWENFGVWEKICHNKCYNRPVMFMQTQHAWGQIHLRWLGYLCKLYILHRGFEPNRSVSLRLALSPHTFECKSGAALISTSCSAGALLVLAVPACWSLWISASFLWTWTHHCSVLCGHKHLCLYSTGNLAHWSNLCVEDNASGQWFLFDVHGSFLSVRVLVANIKTLILVTHLYLLSYCFSMHTTGVK